MGSRWVRVAGPVLLVAGLALAGCADKPAVARTAGSSASPSAGAGPSAAGPSTAAPSTPKPKISKAALDYFLKLTVGQGRDAAVTMWEGPVVQVHLSGTVSAAGRSCADRTVADFNALSPIAKLRITKATGDIELHIVPRSRFRSIEPHADPTGDGFDWATWQAGSDVMTNATVLVRSTGIDDQWRCHVIRRQLTTAMGLLGSSNAHPTSIFSDDPDGVPTTYSALDKQLIKLLYSGTIHPGDKRADIIGEVTTT